MFDQNGFLRTRKARDPRLDGREDDTPGGNGGDGSRDRVCRAVIGGVHEKEQSCHLRHTAYPCPIQHAYYTTSKQAFVFRAVLQPPCSRQCSNHPAEPFSENLTSLAPGGTFGPGSRVLLRNSGSEGGTGWGWTGWGRCLCASPRAPALASSAATPATQEDTQ